MADGELIFDTKINASGFTKGIGKLGNLAKKSVAGIAAATAAASTAISAMAKQATSCYADYEQLIGGVETLFKSSADKVEKYASEAFKNVGMSGNEYMETVTGFAASLISSLGNDTDAAAEKANMALTDMSDNANKMGSDLESIKNAYAGFSKQNYTMLDNLKLGYGGTKEEMQRLLDKAKEIQKTKFGVDVDYDISSFADIVDAIHVIQTEMDITGTTAKEASTTISGSISAMKAAWTDLMTGIADPTQDFDRLLGNVVDSVVTVADNLAPRIAAVLPQMADGLTKLTNDLLPLIPETINNLLPSVLDGADSLISALLDTLSKLGTTVIPIISDNIGNIVDTLVSGLSEAAPELIRVAGELCTTFTEAIADNSETITKGSADIVATIIKALSDNSDRIIAAAAKIIASIANGLSDALPDLIPKAVDVVLKISETLLDHADELGDAAVKLIVALMDGLTAPETLNKIVQEAPVIIEKLCKALLDLADDVFDVGIAFAAEVIKGLAEFDWAGNITEINDKLYNLGASMHQALTDGYNNEVREKNSDFIAQFADKTKSELEQMRVDITDEESRFKNAWNDYVNSGYSSIDEYLKYRLTTKNGVALNTLKEEAEKQNLSVADYLDTKIRGLEEQRSLITDAISEGNYYDPTKSIADGYAENARNAANTKAWVPDTSAAEAANNNLEKSNNDLAENTEETAETVTESTDKITDEFKEFYDNLKFLKSKGVKNGGISEADYLKQLSDKLHSSKEYDTAPYASYWDEIKDDAEESTDKITDTAKEQWEQINRLNKLGIYNDRQAQAERLKWIKAYCPKYADEYYDYYSEVYGYQQSAEAESLKSTKETLSKQADIVKDKLSEISSEYQTKYKEIQSKISTYKSALLSVGKTFSIEESEDKNGNKTKAYKVADVAKRLEQMKKYHESLLKLRDMDASPALLTEIINLGAEDGAYMAEHLVKDKSFSKFNDLYKQLDAEAQSMANEFYAPDVQKLNDDTAAKITAAYSDLPTEFGALGAAAAEAFVSGMSGDISDKITQNITNLTNGVSTALDSMKTDFDFLDFLDSSDFKQAGIDAGQEFSKGFSSAVSEIDAAKNSIKVGAVSLAPPVYSSSGTSASGGSTDTVINAKIYTTVTLDGDKVGQSVTNYQFRHSQEGGS